MIMPNVQNGFEQGGAGGKNALFVGGSNVPTYVSFEITAGGGDACEVKITFEDGKNQALAKPFLRLIHLSDNADGVGLTATSASGIVTAKTGEGEVFATVVAKKLLEVQTKADGTFTLEITDTAKTGFYVCVQHPLTGEAIVSRQLLTADYGVAPPIEGGGLIFETPSGRR